jgi:hypothetical protein
MNIDQQRDFYLTVKAENRLREIDDGSSTEFSEVRELKPIPVAKRSKA